MCGGGSKKAAPKTTTSVVADPAAAQRSQAVQEQAQRQVNAAKLVSSTDSQLPGSFGSELAAQ